MILVRLHRRFLISSLPPELQARVDPSLTVKFRILFVISYLLHPYRNSPPHGMGRSIMFVEILLLTML
jgi:hypothetical protein